jgi:hypothetical protein
MRQDMISPVDILTRETINKANMNLVEAMEGDKYDPVTQTIPANLRSLLSGGTSVDTISGSPRCTDDNHRDI